jgi:3-deoxy-D-manno-octulosonic acid (KDO) 8-phosphate synthase
VHECPERAPSDGPNALPLERMESLLLMLRDIHYVVMLDSSRTAREGAD